MSDHTKPAYGFTSRPVPISWERYGVAEYLMSTRIRPKLLSDPNRYRSFPLRNRHCDDLGLFMKLQAVNGRMAVRFSENMEKQDD